ncbi:MAG: hypothetical protein GX621_01550, partial [Pirellulaceae bacterium]|nr:hypothetical protein [Pirellulaceae bacterium]
LYRVEGSEGDKLVYQVPGPIKRVRVWTWAPSGDDDILEMAAGVPGGSSRKVDTVQRKRSFTPYQRKGISAIEVRHQSEDFVDDDRLLELRLKNRGWIDRVEIYY